MKFKNIFLIAFIFSSTLLLNTIAWGQTTYTWQGADAASWATSTNWTPTRTTPATNDVLQFDTGTTLTITSVPTQTIGRFVMSNSTAISLQAAVASSTLTIGNGAGDDLVIPSGSSLTISTNVNVTLATSTTADISGTLTVNASRTYNTNGTSVVTTVNGPNGIINNAGTVSSAATKLSFASGGKYQHNQDAGTIPTSTWNANSTCEITGVTANHPSGVGQAFGHFTWNSSVQTAADSFGTGFAVDNAIQGNLTIQNTGSSLVRFTSTAEGTATINGNLVISGGQLDIAYSSSTNRTVAVLGNFSMSAGTMTPTVSTSTDGTLNVSGDFSLSGGTINMSSTAKIGIINVSGNFSHSAGTITETSTGSGSIVFNKSGTQTYTSGGTISNTVNFTVNSGSTLQMAADTTTITGGGTFTLSSGATLGITSTAGITSSGATGNVQVTGTRSFSTGANYTYNGSAAQAAGNGLPSTVNNLTINNSSGVTLSANETVNGTLTLSSGNVSAGANTLSISSTGSVTRTSGHVVGNLQKNVATGATSRTFEIGDSSNYTPINVSFGNVTSAGDLTANTTAGDHPSITNSGIIAAKSVNRYWTMTNSGVGFDTYSATFNFVAGDIDSGASTNNFSVGKLDGGTWTLPAIATRSATSIQATGMTSFSDFQVGEQPSSPGGEPPPRGTLTINSTSPTNGATSVAVNTSVSATFSMLMNGSTLTTDTFKLSGGGNEVAGSVTTNGATATFTPSANLDYNTTYTARVTTGAQAANFGGTTLDNDYTWSFTTTGDADPPTVSSTNPANGAAGVAINSAITATFSEAMQSSTINTNTFTVSDGSNTISGTVSYSDTTATFTPSGSLSNSTTYTAKITTEVRDSAGNTMASGYTWSFTTVDTTLPTVSSTTPANGATGVAINSTVTATFSEAMLSSAMNPDTFTVSDGSGVIGGTVSYSDKTATFTPTNSLSDSTTYTARITTGAMDLAGNALASDYTWSFTTVDTTQPTVSSTTPADGDDGVAINSAVTATFSEAMQASTINTNTFTVSDSSGAVSGTVSYSGTIATFTPSRNLSDSTIYTAKITTRVKDISGNALASDYTWSFTTGDFIAPTVRSTSPVNGDTGVAINRTITATFREAMQSSTINTNTFTVSDGKGNISGTVSYNGTTATFTPSKNLSDSTTYTARITRGVKDLADNAMASDYTWSFATVDTTLPIVRSTSPAKGATGVAINSIITATFSETMQSSSINTNTFTVSDGSGNISGTVSYSGITATFTPLSNLSHSTIYTARITTGARDLAGNAMASDYSWSFTTTGDVDPPTVSSTNPANGGAGVAINRIITATFSEEMQSSTIDTNTFTVSDGSDNISGSVSYNDTTAAFKPSNNLSTFTTYTAKIATGARDLAGNAMASLYTWSFMTAGDIDITAPTVSSTSPVNGAAGVDVSSVITAAFSEEMDASTITTDTFIINNGSDDIRGTVSYTDTTATFTPSGNLPSYTTYTARITTEVRDLAGNAVASDYTWSFTTTGDFAVPTIRSTSPVNGAAGVDVGSIITATFSENMDASTITANTFTVNDGSSNISGTVSYGDKKATFTPSDNLAYSATYTAMISTEVMDSAENALSSPYTWSFTTESAPIVTPTITPMATATLKPTPVETGAIEAWVTDAVTGEGISDAAVTLDTDQLTTINAECDQDGFCQFRDLAVGNYTVTASAPGYTSESQDATVTGGGTTVVTFALSAVPIQTPTPILCNAEKIEASPEEIKLQKKKKATVLISIICEDGVTPVIGETVTARVKTGKDRVRVSPSIAVTDDNGQAVFKIAAKNETGKARIQFKTSNLRAVVEVKVLK